MIVAPVQWFVRLLGHLPDLLRPGVFLAAVLLVGAYVVAGGGLVYTWHAVCRGVAIAVEGLIGLALVPEYLVTSRRRAVGAEPWSLSLAVGDVTDRLLDGVEAFHNRHEHQPFRWRTLPWALAVGLVVVCGALWIGMNQARATSEPGHQLSMLFEHWRDVEAWADVPQDRRAVAGPALADPQAMPSVAAMRRHGAVVWVRLMCPGKNACHGKVVLRNRTGREVIARAVKLKSSTSDVVALRVRDVSQARGRLGVMVKPA